MGDELYLIRPGAPGPAAELAGDVDSLCAWMRDHASFVTDCLRTRGGILLRGFALSEPAHFTQVIAAAGQDGARMEYVGGTTPRELVSETVYTSTSAPAFLRIPQHSEMSYLKEYPSRILFFCRLPSPRGGETPVSDNRRVLAALDPRVRAQFAARGVRYVRHLARRRTGSAWLARRLPFLRVQSWQGVFRTEEPAAVDQACRGRFTSHRWLPDGSLWIESVLPAVRRHPATGEEVWFNQAYFSQIHPRILGPAGRLLAPLLKLYHWLTGKPFTNATYGDGGPLSDQDLHAVMDAIEANTFAFRWQRGDVLILDNLLKAHGRNPFRGPRQILVGMLG